MVKETQETKLFSVYRTLEWMLNQKKEKPLLRQSEKFLIGPYIGQSYCIAVKFIGDNDNIIIPQSEKRKEIKQKGENLTIDVITHETR